MSEYAVIVLKEKRSYQAYAPDLPGCVAVGRNEDEAMQRIADAIAAHLRGMADDRVAPPRPTTRVFYAQAGGRDTLRQVSRLLKRAVRTGVKTGATLAKRAGR